MLVRNHVVVNKGSRRYTGVLYRGSMVINRGGIEGWHDGV